MNEGMAIYDILSQPDTGTTVTSLGSH